MPSSHPAGLVPATALLRQCKGLLCAALLLPLGQPLQALELNQQDEHGNVNQLNIGVGKSNRLGNTLQDQQRLTRQMRLDSYNSIELRVPATLTWWGGKTPSATLEADAAVLRALDFKVSGGRLVISGDNFSTQQAIEITLYGGQLHDILLQGGYDATFHQLNSNHLKIRTRGSGELTIDGSAMRCRLEVDGAHDIDLQQMQCKELDLEVLGSADISGYASQSVTGLVQGTADVTISGNPERKAIKVTGIADVSYE